jgi:iron complex outermembrane receptor protein
MGLALSSTNILADTDIAENENIQTLEAMTVTASADASAEGLIEAYSGGQVGSGGRAGILGTEHYMDSPFSITSYTNALIRDREARSVGDVLQNDSSVRVARGFGNFQESYFIRGFILGSDDIAFNGLYSLLPRQYIATELFERVEVLRGASSFLTGATPGGGGVGGSINLVPKRAPNTPLTRVTVGSDNGKQGYVSADVARRFGEEQQFGVRVNTAYRDGETAVDDEGNKLGLFAVGLDWHNDKVRLSADLGYQNNELDETRTNVTLSGLTSMPSAPDSSSNWAQPWSYSDEEDTFATFRAEVDLAQNVTTWAAYGLRRSNEENSLANFTMNNINGDGAVSRFDNTREDEVDTAEIGLRGFFQTGSVSHDWVVAISAFQLEKKNAYQWDFFNTLSTNIYNPSDYALPAFSGTGFSGNELNNPQLTERVKLISHAVGDTLGLFDDQLLVTLGARYQKIDVEGFAYGTGASSGKYSKGELTPVVGAVFKLNESWSVYGNYIESLKKGDTAPTTSGGSPVTNAGEVQSPYVSVQKEIGVKYDSGDLGLALAYFTTDKPRSFVDASSTFRTSGEDQHQGIELTSFGLLTGDIKVLGGLTWLDAKQQETGDSSVDGNRVIGIPEVQANLGLEWGVPSVSGLAFDSRVVYTSSVYADNANSLKVPSWTRVDLGAKYVVGMQSDRDLTLRLRVNNVFDRDYWASSGGYENNGYLVLGSPRSVTLSASVDF